MFVLETISKLGVSARTATSSCTLCQLLSKSRGQSVGLHTVGLPEPIPKSLPFQEHISSRRERNNQGDKSHDSIGRHLHIE